MSYAELLNIQHFSDNVQRHGSGTMSQDHLQNPFKNRKKCTHNPLKVLLGGPWAPKGGPIGEGGVIQTPFLMISAHFWAPFGFSFSPLVATFLGRFFPLFPKASPRQNRVDFGSIFGGIVDAFKVLFGGTWA